MIRAVDLFCGAGGTSTGLAQAAAGRDLRLLAVNHWERAVETHAANHPWADHLCASIETVDPRKVVPDRRLELLVASPECTHHSTARGGRPMSDQSRASAWHVLHWATELRVDNILIENVREFASWGPLGANGRPLRSRKGETFRAFIQALRSLNYRVEWRVLNAADFGDATTRERLFICARRGNRRIRWPEPTHGAPGEDGLSEAPSPWRPAREVIDWGLRGESIFARARPLVPRTLERIAEGLRRFGGEAAEPFLVMLRGTSPSQVRGSARSTDKPLPTITGGGIHAGLVQPFILPQFAQNGPRSVDRPLGAITTTNRGMGLVEPFLLGQQSGAVPRPVSEPAPTVAAKGAISLVEPFLVPYYRHANPRRVTEPVPTITTRDRLGLVEASPRLDILFRMLQPHELAAAMSFPEGYRFCGTKTDAVRMIGNAVPVRTAEALCGALLGAA